VGAIASSNPENVILFPKTIEYYQKELTRMLEGERYLEAARLLKLLLKCRNDDPQYKEEWQSLLDWLTTTFPETAEDREADAGEFGDEDDEDSEAGMLRRHVRDKAANDSKYPDKLMDMLDPHAPVARQMMALEQLAHLDRQTVGERLRSWLRESRLHPLVQFRGLQVLKTIGEIGTIEIHKLGQKVTLAIAEVPLAYDQFPQRVRSVAERVASELEPDEPGLIEFAAATWNDFLGFVYGTSVYEELLAIDDSAKDVWAAALHHTLQETVAGSADDESLSRRYRLPESAARPLQRAKQVIKLFATVSNPSDV
jgi:hypothetical protein